jgi:hypothetical protein
MNELLLGPYIRLLESLPPNPEPILEASGFLDLLVPEVDGGGGASLQDLFPLALETGRRLPPGKILMEMARRAVDPVPPALAAVIAAGEMAGALIAVETLTLDYVRTRRQFGREIGRFQAIQQQIAILTEEVMVARMAAEMAFTGNLLSVSERRAALAKIRCNQAAKQVAAIAHAVHGAIGVSEEYSLHRYTRRLRELAMVHGGESIWSRSLGEWALNDPRDITSLARAL